MEIKKEIKRRLEQKLYLIHFEIKDFTGRHLNHKLHEGGFHLETTIVSDDFIDKNLMEMSPLEAVTYLCAAIQLADGQLDHQERQEWLVAVAELFPEFSEDRADNFLMQAQTTINQLNISESSHYLKEVLDRIKSLLTSDQITALSSKIANLIEADGIIMTSEIEIVSMIEKELGITISFDQNL